MHSPRGKGTLGWPCPPAAASRARAAPAGAARASLVVERLEALADDLHRLCATRRRQLRLQQAAGSRQLDGQGTGRGGGQRRTEVAVDAVAEAALLARGQRLARRRDTPAQALAGSAQEHARLAAGPRPRAAAAHLSKHSVRTRSVSCWKYCWIPCCAICAGPRASVSGQRRKGCGAAARRSGREHGAPAASAAPGWRWGPAARGGAAAV